MFDNAGRPDFLNFRKGATIANDVSCRLAPIAGRQHIIYAAINRYNLKMYVGLTSKPLHVRVGHHFSAATAGSRSGFHAALRKYGRAGFDFYTVLQLPTYEMALVEECQTIETMRPEYNLTKGGEGRLGFKVSEATRRKMSEAAKARKGHPQTEKARAATLRMQKISREKAKRAVVCDADSLTFGSVTEAAAYYAMTCSQASRACKTGKPVRGLKLRYAGVLQ